MRRSRVQGGWNAPTKPSHTVHVAKHNFNIGDNKTSDGVLGKFTPVENAIQEETKVFTISTPGDFVLSDGPSGPSQIRFYKEFIDIPSSHSMFEDLLNSIKWVQQCDVYKDKRVVQPRLTFWYSDYGYAYSGVRWEPNTAWHPIVLKIKGLVEDNLGTTFNSCLLNLYRDGHDSVDWHADDEPPLGPVPLIASVSLGETRVFELKQKHPEYMEGKTVRKEFRVHLTEGSLLIMEGHTQQDWLHRVPKEYHDRSPRINLTFRQMFPRNLQDDSSRNSAAAASMDKSKSGAACIELNNFDILS